ncbi:MAG TPA: DUF707 domain-containing protein [Bacteroidales bacterium]|nr:DUF707 domain-containing protein [Bacteroidales bacterium]
MEKIDKNILQNSENDTCIIAAVGQGSLHMEWIQNEPQFDLHLIVYDESYQKYQSNADFIIQSEGYKYELIYDYLKCNPKILDYYKYFYLPDDDVSINTKNIHSLFRYMQEYDLAIAQPALCSDSYYSFPHTVRQKDSILRYTNFVEVMQPCFSKGALSKTLFTFKNTGQRWAWGTDYHWGKLVDYKKYNMAIIDDLISRHTRPVQTEEFENMYRYINRHSLNTEIFITQPIRD